MLRFVSAMIYAATVFLTMQDPTNALDATTSIGVQPRDDSTTAGCPAACTCVLASYIPSVYCIQKDLYSVPRSLPERVKLLSLHHNRLRRITAADFAKLPMLETLNLMFSNVEQIDEDAFQMLRHLKSLNLAGNRLKTLPDRLFENLTELEELYLNDNELTSLPPRLLSSLTKLRRLYLHKNDLQQLSSGLLHNVVNLLVLRLEYNHIERVEYDAFDSLRRLAWLRLNNNNLSSMAWNSFDGLNSIKQIHLDHNNFKTLPSTVFRNKSQLSMVTLYDNPWHCDCSIAWLHGLLNGNDKRFLLSNGIRCSLPSSLDGVALASVEQKQLVCDSMWSSWEAWSVCDKTCDGGLRFRIRACVDRRGYRKPNSECSGESYASHRCNTSPCPIGVLTTWTSWGKCSTTCGFGTAVRSRVCKDPVTGEKTSTCKGQLLEVAFCNRGACIVDGAWAQWSEWASCSRTCGIGINTRTRKCTNPPPSYGGRVCPGGYAQTQNKLCHREACPTVARWEPWSSFEPCSVTCGVGEQIRRRSCLDSHDNPSHSCTGHGTETSRCALSDCPIHGGWSAWSGWSPCYAILCKKFKRRSCSNPQPLNGGEYCPGTSTNSKVCDTRACQLYTVWNQWGAWSQCSKSCEGGTQTRYRSCPGEYTFGLTCGRGRNEHRRCNEQDCPSKAFWGAWQPWSSCVGECEGTQSRNRECIAQSESTDASCDGADTEEKVCYLSSCDNGKQIQLEKAPKNCQYRGDPKNGKEVLTVNGNSVDATYSCYPFYRLRGSKSAHCNSSVGWSDPVPPRCVQICGKTTYTPNNRRQRILGGNIARKGSWPWQVAIETRLSFEGWKLRCGGTLINDEWVVTAAHCLFVKEPVVHLLDPVDFKIFVGAYNITARSNDPDVQFRTVEHVIVHPNFDETTLNNDIGLLKLNRPIQFNDFVRPVCLPFKQDARSSTVKPKELGVVLGWGATRTGEASEILRELHLPVVSRRKCIKAYQKEKYLITNNMFCAGWDDKPFDTCKGDSGGAYMLLDDRRKKYTLQGIISWGGDRCGDPGKYSVYTNVNVFASWIRKKIRAVDQLKNSRG